MAIHAFRRNMDRASSGPHFLHDVLEHFLERIMYGRETSMPSAEAGIGGSNASTMQILELCTPAEEMIVVLGQGIRFSRCVASTRP